MQKISSIIIDDELNAIKTLEWEINNLDLVIEVVGKFTDVQEAIAFLSHNSHHIDLVFLDIQMPTMDGFEFLERFTGRHFEVVFVTAYDEYAIKAIKESALDYILKPVEASELELALKKVNSKKSRITKENNQNNFNKISFPVDNKLILINPQDIIYCKSDGNYSKICTLDDTLFISKTLKYVKGILPKSLFYRIHQSYLVNLNHVEAFDRSTNYVKLKTGKELPVSRSKRHDFLEQL